MSRSNPYSCSAQLALRWQTLCGHYLPIAPESIWRYSRELQPDDPPQGWKLHISATILTAGDVLRRVAPLLRHHNVLYKAPRSLLTLQDLNSGILGYSQVGKFITVYPTTDREAVLLARKLDKLTRGFCAPAIPFDGKYREGGCVYYRYGVFSGSEEKAAHAEVDAIRNPQGKLVKDERELGFKPNWLTDPFADQRVKLTTPAPPTPLRNRFKAFAALAQRGRGGVYQAIDFGVNLPRLCILKEGRKDGEVDWLGRDGIWRIKHEQRVLRLLRKKGVAVPRVLSSFKADGSYFMALEFIEGQNLMQWLQSKQRRISIQSGLRMSAQLARLVLAIHTVGWIWRDCKPANIVLTKQKQLMLLDFEGACEVDSIDTLPWGTTPFLAPEAAEQFDGRSRLPEDLYSLGAVVYFLLGGSPPALPTPIRLKTIRKNVPAAADELVMALLSSDPQRRPSARSAVLLLERLCAGN